jgi:hypothetical protein
MGNAFGEHQLRPWLNGIALKLKSPGPAGAETGDGIHPATAVGAA